MSVVVVVHVTRANGGYIFSTGISCLA